MTKLLFACLDCDSVMMQVVCACFCFFVVEEMQTLFDNLYRYCFLEFSRKYKLPYSCIIPFPKATDPSTAQEFTTGSQVLAVYPGTTALYRAAVAAHRKVF
jgi:hypothetical protein